MKKSGTTNEDLARMVQKGFDEAKNDRESIREQLNQNSKKLSSIKKDVDENSKRLSVIETDISEIRKTYVDPREFDDLMARVKYLEVKVGVESGR